MPDLLPDMNLIIQSGLLSYGKWGKLFEHKLGEYIGESKVLTVNSFNSAMLITITVLGLKPNDEVIASPMSCLASNQPFATQGLKVIWADVNPLTGLLDPESVKTKITKKTKAIFHNHFCGYVGNIDEINLIAKEFGLFVVDDAIEGFGSEYKAKKIGNVDADITVFSFQTVRLPNTIEGGAIAFKNKNLYEKAKLVRDYGIDRTKFRTNLGEIDVKCDISLPGYGATLNELNSYIGCLQMDDINSLIDKQRINAMAWTNIIQRDFEEMRIVKPYEGTLANYWVFGVLTPEKDNTLKYFREKGYYCSGVHLPNNYYSVFGKNTYLKGVSEFYSKFLALPCGWWCDINNVNYV